MFVNKVDYATGRYSCLGMENIPDLTAYSYRENQGDFEDMGEDAEISNRHIDLNVLSDLISQDLKTTFKAH